MSEQTPEAEKKSPSANTSEAEQHTKQQSLLERSLLEQIEAISIALENGTLANVSKKLASLQKKLDTLDTHTAKQHEGKVHLLQGKLKELKDWQSYAAMPKKQELCEKMEKLIDAKLPTKELADAIKGLQQQWKALKGGGKEEEQQLWLKFKEASDKAYEPCKQYFSQLAEQRTENLKQREKICSELEQFYKNYNWQEPDWKAVNKIMETASSEFHRFSPVNHKDQKAIKERFNHAAQPILDNLRVEQKVHEAEKARLVENAKKLTSMEDNNESIKQAKQLQQQWKNVGITRKKEDQKLWKQFRLACDQIFDKRNNAKKEALEEIRKIIQQAEEICQKIEALSKLPAEEILKQQSSLEPLKKSFKALDLYKDKNKKLFKRFHQACDHYKDNLSRAKKEKQQYALLSALQASDLCDQMENGSEISEQTWISMLEKTDDLRKNILNERFKQAKSASTQNNSNKNEQHRRLILVQLEILLDKDTPNEDKDLRMTHQLSQLSSKGMTGKAPQNKQQQVQTLIQQWLASQAGPTETQKILSERFASLVNQS